jgi:hypothetical protein
MKRGASGSQKSLDLLVAKIGSCFLLTFEVTKREEASMLKICEEATVIIVVMMIIIDDRVSIHGPDLVNLRELMTVPHCFRSKTKLGQVKASEAIVGDRSVRLLLKVLNWLPYVDGYPD